MIANKKQFMTGTILLIAFAVVLALIFMPIGNYFGGLNILEYMDSLFNSISKGSAYYIDGLRGEAKAYEGTNVSLDLMLETETAAKEIASIISKNDGAVTVTGAELKMAGDLGVILGGCLADADEMFANNGTALVEKYGSEEKRVMYNWWSALKAADKALKRQSKFSESKFVLTVIKKGVECSYNYYGIEPQKITEQFLIVLAALVFYVVYTLWYGFAILFMFEGWGLKLEH